jgi:putative addiction module antidote
MTISLKITQIGNSLGVILPKELLAGLKVAKGDVLICSETPNGFQISPYDPEVARQLEVGREFMKEYRDTLRALAK